MCGFSYQIFRAQVYGSVKKNSTCDSYQQLRISQIKITSITKIHELQKAPK